MPEKLKVRVIKTGDMRTIDDAVPIKSAAEFWQMSDAIWHQKPPELKLACFSLGAKMPVEKARDTLNEVLAHIDEKLVVSAIDKVMQMEGPHSDDKISFNPGFLASPAAVHIGTYNWDDRNTWRYANVDGVVQGVEFTDGHKDRHRELFASLDFTDKSRSIARLNYSMQRIQMSQDTETSLNMSIWHSDFAETGYEGNHPEAVPLSVAQEIKVIGALQAMSGIVFDRQHG